MPAEARQPAGAPAGVTRLDDDFGNYGLPAGSVLVSTSGRTLSPSPKFDASTPRKRALSLKRQRAWLIDEAIKEAEARRDDVMRRVFAAMNPDNVSRADFDDVNDYLFGNIDGPTAESFRATPPRRDGALVQEAGASDNPLVGTVEEVTDGGTAKLDRAGAGSLEGAPAEPVSGVRGDRDTGTRAADRGGADAPRDVGSGGRGLPGARGVGAGAERVPVSAARDDDAGERGDGTRDDRREPARSTDREGLEPASGRTAAEDPADFAIAEDDAIGDGGQKTKFRNNVAAIRLLKALEEEGRQATRAEQKVLAKYVGWGGLPQAFERSDGSFSTGWEKEGAELKALLTPEEYKAAAASTRNAHYTSTEIVAGMWEAMRRLGFDGGRLLEPSVGVGNFFGLMPEDFRAVTALHGAELDLITGGIAKHFYPSASIALMGFQDYTIPDGYFDAVIGNPPFGSEKLYDPNDRTLSRFSIHNYFIAKSLKGLKPGGVMAVVVTNRMMDAANDAARSYITERADLLGAIRLPNNAFAKNAGTEVTTDILFFRRRGEGEEPAGERWTEVERYTDRNGNVVPLNEYFVRHPEMMLGEFGAFGTMYRPDDPALIAREGQNTARLLREAIERLPANVATPAARAPVEEPVARTMDVAHVRVGSMFVAGDKVMIRQPDLLGEPRAAPVDGLTGTGRERVIGMIRIRDALAELRWLQLNPTASSDRIETARKHLNKVYDECVARHGYIHGDANKRVFRDDPSWPQLLSLEVDYDKGVSAAVSKSTGAPQREPSAKKAAIFSKRTQSPYTPPTRAATAKDALVASLSVKGRVDLDFMQILYGQPKSTITDELSGLIFKDPDRGWVTREEYLSGNVKAKLAAAREAPSAMPPMRRMSKPSKPSSRPTSPPSTSL